MGLKGLEIPLKLEGEIKFLKGTFNLEIPKAQLFSRKRRPIFVWATKEGVIIMSGGKTNHL